MIIHYKTYRFVTYFVFVKLLKVKHTDLIILLVDFKGGINMANGTGKLIQHRFTIHPLFYCIYEDPKVQANYLEGLDTKTEFIAAQYSITLLKDVIDKNIILIDRETGAPTIKNLDIDTVYQYIAEKRLMRRNYDTRRNYLFSGVSKKSSPHILLTPYYFPLYIKIGRAHV